MNGGTFMVTKVQSFVMDTYKRVPLQIVKGKGSFVWDQEGKRYLDFTSGIATNNLGHVPETVKHALTAQLEELWHCSNLYTIQPQEQLAEILVKNSCFDKVFFCNSGAEANEAALKLARIYANQNSLSSEVITFRQSFHGRTLMTLTASGQEKIQKGFEPLVQGFRYLPFNGFASIEEIAEIKPCAVLLELVQGEGGVIPADKMWVDQLVAVCKANNILILVDEVQTGIGRTGSLFAYEQYGFEPDIISLAKGLGSGFPIGAILAKKEIAKYFSPGTHGSTFGGNPLAATAGLATVKELTETDILKSSKDNMAFLWGKLLLLKDLYPFIKDVRGVGYLIGVEFDRDATSIIDKARDKGLLILSAGPKVVRILPPLTASKEEIELFFHLFTLVLSELEGDI